MLGVQDLSLHIKESGSVWEAVGFTPPDYLVNLRNDPENARRFTRMLYELHQEEAEQLSELVRELQRAAAPGARIVYYSLYDQDLLHTLGPQIPENELKALQDIDNVFIYPMVMVRTRDSL